MHLSFSKLSGLDDVVGAAYGGGFATSAARAFLGNHLRAGPDALQDAEAGAAGPLATVRWLSFNTWRQHLSA